MCFWVELINQSLLVSFLLFIFRIAEVNLEFKTLFNSPDTNTLISQQALAYSIGLQNTLHDAQARLTKTYERSKSFPAADVELVLTEADKGILKARDRCPLALECVIITTLCNLNKRFLMMEAAAASKFCSGS